MPESCIHYWFEWRLAVQVERAVRTSKLPHGYKFRPSMSLAGSTNGGSRQGHLPQRIAIIKATFIRSAVYLTHWKRDQKEANGLALYPRPRLSPSCRLCRADNARFHHRNDADTRTEASFIARDSLLPFNREPLPPTRSVITHWPPHPTRMSTKGIFVQWEGRRLPKPSDL